MHGDLSTTQTKYTLYTAIERSTVKRIHFTGTLAHVGNVSSAFGRLIFCIIRANESDPTVNTSSGDIFTDEDSKDVLGVLEWGATDNITNGQLLLVDKIMKKMRKLNAGDTVVILGRSNAASGSVSWVGNSEVTILV